MTRTVGVEEEFLLVQVGSVRLAPQGDAVVASAEQRSDGQFEHELQREQAELGTEPHRHTDSLERDLRGRRADLGAAAREQGARLLASGSSPSDEHASTTVEARYERIMELFGRIARGKLTCGMHVHVSVSSPEEGVAVLDRIRGWLPILTALSANSPFAGGEDTEYASYRSIQWGQWPTAGATDPFGSVEGYERARDALVGTGAAIDAGGIYFDARLSATYPTVEIRVCDVCADVRDAITIAALARALVATVADRAATGGPVPEIRSEMLRAASWRAARWGMEGELVDAHAGRLVPAWELVDTFVEMIGTALREAGDEDLVREGLERIRSRGTGARLQREAYAGGGFDAVVDALAEVTLAEAGAA